MAALTWVTLGMRVGPLILTHGSADQRNGTDALRQAKALGDVLVAGVATQEGRVTCEQC
jgi:hypothetical protein